MRSCFSVSTWDPAVVVSASSHKLSVHCTVKYNYEPVAYYELPEVITLFIGDEIKKKHCSKYSGEKLNTKHRSYGIWKASY